MISCLKFLLTADDFEKDLIFHYKENNKTDVFKRRCHLPLKREYILSVPPKVSEIIHKPDRPKIGETLTLSCTVDDFCPGDIAILWSKGWTDFAEEQFVQVPRIGENGLYSTFTQLEVELKPDDEPEEFSCEIRHQGLKMWESMNG
uniref:Ig-like domain-containing protein n=1 Tax=Callorhinchus milii TaxID=7868 RepID=A0A4W3IN71_CALMI